MYLSKRNVIKLTLVRNCVFVYNETEFFSILLLPMILKLRKLYLITNNSIKMNYYEVPEESIIYFILILL